MGRHPRTGRLAPGRRTARSGALQRNGYQVGPGALEPRRAITLCWTANIAATPHRSAPLAASSRAGRRRCPWAPRAGRRSRSRTRTPATKARYAADGVAETEPAAQAGTGSGRRPGGQGHRPGSRCHGSDVRSSLPGRHSGEIPRRDRSPRAARDVGATVSGELPRSVVEGRSRSPTRRSAPAIALPACGGCSPRGTPPSEVPPTGGSDGVVGQSGGDQDGDLRLASGRWRGGRRRGGEEADDRSSASCHSPW